MNIPDDEFFTLLEQALRSRGHENLQRTLYTALREAILRGTLVGDSRLPGSRVMAQRLGLSRNTINSALEQLATEGYLLRSRQGTYVALLRPPGERSAEEREIVLPEYLQRLPAGTRRDSPTLLFAPGIPAVNYFPLAIWRRLLDRVMREEGSALLGYGDAQGELMLRKAIARHLALSRGIRCDAGQIVITQGALEGVDVCTHLLSVAGETAWVSLPM